MTMLTTFFLTAIAAITGNYFFVAKSSLNVHKNKQTEKFIESRTRDLKGPQGRAVGMLVNMTRSR